MHLVPTGKLMDEAAEAGSHISLGSSRQADAGNKGGIMGGRTSRQGVCLGRARPSWPDAFKPAIVDSSRQPQSVLYVLTVGGSYRLAPVGTATRVRHQLTHKGYQVIASPDVSV